MALSDILKNLRKEAGLTQRELAEKTGLPLRSIINYENGMREPNAKALAVLEITFNVSGAYLMGLVPSRSLVQPNARAEFTELTHRYMKLDRISQQVVLAVIEEEEKRLICTNQNGNNMTECPLSENCIYLQLSEQSASAGTGIYLGPEAFRSIKVVKNDKTRRAAFCVRVSGDSMDPLYSDGDIVMISRDSVQLGDIALVTLNGNGYIKRLGNGCLLSENKNYGPIPCQEGAIVNGRVIGVLQPEWIVEM